MISDALTAHLRAIILCAETPPCLSVTLPMAAPSVANLREHWGTKRARAKMQRGAAFAALAPRLRKLRVALPVVVLLVRVAPRRLDGDNAERAMKSLRDGVADALGVADNDARVEWVVDQEKGAAAVRVEVYK